MDSSVQVGLDNYLATIVSSTLNLHQMSGLAVLLDHLHRPIAGLHELTQLRSVGLYHLLALGGGHQLIGVDELSVTIVGDDHLWRGRLDSLLMMVVDGVRIVARVVDFLAQWLLDLKGNIHNFS